MNKTVKPQGYALLAALLFFSTAALPGHATPRINIPCAGADRLTENATIATPREIREINFAATGARSPLNDPPRRESPPPQPGALPQWLQISVLTLLALLTAALALAYALWRQVVTRAKNLQTEIEERRRAEAALRESEARLKIVFERANDAIHIANADDEILDANPRLCELMGYTREELLNMRVRDLQAPERRINEKTLQTEAQLYGGNLFEGLNIRRDGKRIPVEVSISRIENPRGDLYVSIVRDITERKQVEEALRVSKSNLSALIENTDGSIWAIDAHYRLMVSNAEFIRNTSAALGHPLQSGESVLCPEFPSQVNKEWQGYYDRALRGETFSIEALTRFREKHRRIEYRFNPIRDGEKILGVTVYGRDVTERRQAEETLRKSEQNLRKAQHYAHVGSWTWHIQQNRLEWSEEMYDIFGIDKETFTGDLADVVARAIHPDDREKVEHSNRSVAEQGKPIPLEYRVVLQDGTVRAVWGEAGELILDEEGKPVSLSGTVQDLTERKWMDDTLRKSEERYRALFDNMTEGFALHELVFDENGVACDYRFIDINPAFERLTGLKRENLLGKTQREILPTEDTFWLETYSQVALSGKSIQLEHYSPALEKTYEVYAYRPAPDQFAVIFMDVSKRKQAEANLQRRLLELQTLYENGLAISAAKNPYHIGKRLVETLSANLSWHHIVVRVRREDSDALELIAFQQPNLTPQNIVAEEKRLNKLVGKIGEGLSGMVMQTGQPLLVENVREHPNYCDTYPGIRSGMYVPMMIGESAIGCITVESEKDGVFTEQDLRLLSTLAAQTETALENARLYRSAQMELRERMRAEEEVRRLNANLETRIEERTAQLQEAQEQLMRQEKLAMLGQMAGSVGHELRNPLSVIANAVYFLKIVQGNAEEKIKDYLRLIEENVNISNKIIADLLDFTRIKSAEREPIAVRELVAQTLERFPAPKQVRVQFELPEDLPEMYADRQHAIQILGNLTLNACQAMNLQGGGELTITARREGDAVSIQVRDTGPGITAENLKKIFEPLFTTKPKGIGLGLAVSRKLAEANGGKIEAQSALGTGSIFTLQLPSYRRPA